jgi:hypothetical protein
LVLAELFFDENIGASETNFCFFRRVIVVADMRIPVITVAFTRTFRRVAALKGLAGSGLDPLPDRLSYSCDFF